MKIIMTLCVRDEADIVRENIEFHLNAGVDFIIATDNRSSDETEAILKEYERAGVLRYLYAPSPFFMQSHYVTKMARMAYDEYQADWVINNDVDEFWWTPDGDLKSLIQSYSEQQRVDAVNVNRIDFVSDQSNETQPLRFYQHMIKRRFKSTNSFGQPLPSKIMHRADPLVSISAGNHDADGELIKHKIQAFDDDIVIFHFPLRSYENFVRKATKDYQARRKNIFFLSLSGTYLEYNRLYKEGGLREYYDNYCAVDDTKNEVASIDLRFKQRIQKIMQNPKVMLDPNVDYSPSLITKCKKTVIEALVSVYEFSYYLMKKIKHGLPSLIELVRATYHLLRRLASRIIRS